MRELGWENKFQAVDWKDFYPEASEPIPPNVPEPRGKCVLFSYIKIVLWMLTMQEIRLHNNHIQVYCYSYVVHQLYNIQRKQNTVKMCTFGSEFIAAMTAIEMIQAVQYKLCMMGIPIDGPTNMLSDNEAVVRNSTMPESMLRKKHLANGHYCICDGCALGMIQIAKEDGATNLADLLTNSLPGSWLQDIF